MSETPAPDTTRGMLLAAEAAASSRLDGETIVIGGPITVGPSASGEDTARAGGDMRAALHEDAYEDAVTEALDQVRDLEAEIAEVTRERNQARAAVAEIRALHVKERGLMVNELVDRCAHCTELCAGTITWPCPTIGVLGGDHV